ncbi:hypothetical protein GCM10011611_48240 [Aliidongia dinghuensis]|uniref:Lipoprotein n=1 Tax=Aliidongia dinghuensis TaxID=1867774 RepID=A0A8J2YXG8_9PROT|nr:hypothetical protein [Aliidongia dinghuensis]GGF36166.1 hypothetical protein GCM10011611_48240 [Aliidongia dinghuensis]
MSRTKSLIGRIAFVGLCALALAGCYYEPAPYAYGPAPAYSYYSPGYYYGPPVYGSVYVGGGWGHGWGHDHWR